MISQARSVYRSKYNHITKLRVQSSENVRQDKSLSWRFLEPIVFRVWIGTNAIKCDCALDGASDAIVRYPQ
jgi:hypothetical protein